MQKYFALAVLFFLPLSVLAFDIPARPTGFVEDYAHMLSVDQAKALETKLEAYEKSSTNEIAVVTIPSLDGDVIENVAQNIFTKWGIGKKDKNNGVLLLISLSDRKTRIQTGYGVEGDLTDLGTSYIQSDIITPAFKAGDYYGGINGAVDKMIESLGGNNIVPENYSPVQASQGISPIFFILLAGVICIILNIISFFVYKKRKKSGRPMPWWIGRGRGGGFGGGGGGFGGFGGGASGGGGSSGSW
jgi:uncharacterized protein